MKKLVTLCIALLCFGFGADNLFAQSAEKLQSLGLEARKVYEGKESRVQKYLESTGEQRWFITEEGVGYFLDDVSPTGQPLYIRTHNSGAATTIGVDKLREGGGLGINLTGKGMRVGVWEVFGVFQNHVEFGNRVKTQDAASSIDNHATHVAGTLIASGQNPSAKGMAPEAVAWLYTASNDVSEMTGVSAPDQTSMLVSNHSYGPAAGWEFSNGSWRWFGDASVSDQEDYRFGFYDGKARRMDQLAFNAPYFTIVKSAGNDRSDVGDGSRPGDGPYDIIASFGVSKNVVTVGAVQKINEGYSGPGDVQISGFSSWGPTDDGRIKPDIVAAGVSLTSSISTTNESYGNLSGTSMSSPNAAGGFLLLQQLAKQETNNYMRTATLKALIVHTANQANNAGGPDYKHGWGLLNTAGAAEFILNRNELGNFMQERVLNEGETFTMDINPEPNTKVTATISWTDPAGTVSEVQLNPTDLKLVNDLDIRIVDETGSEALPWILDPGSPGLSAKRGDNFRDNIEKIEFENPEPRKYELVVSHKGNLTGGKQAYSVVVTYTPRFEAGDRNVLYWIGNDGNWSEGTNWSVSSGGTAANRIPTSQDRVVFDENSFDGQGQSVNLTSNALVYSLDWLDKSGNQISLNDNQIAVGSSILVSSNSFGISAPGQIQLNGSDGFDLQGNDLTGLTLVFDDPDGDWNLGETLNVDAIDVRKGTVSGSQSDINVKSIISTGSASRTLNLSSSSITGLESVELTGSGLSVNSTNAVFNFENNTSTITAPGISLNANVVNEGGSLDLIGEGLFIKELNVSGDLDIQDNITLNTLRFTGGLNASLSDNILLNIQELWEISDGASVELRSSNTAAKATISVETYLKFCFQNMLIDHVDYSGEARITVGTSSTLESADGWLTEECNDVLFSNFDFEFNCVNGLTYFTNESSGDIVRYSWDFGDGNSSEDMDAYHVFAEENSYEVTLTIINGNESESFTRMVAVGPNQEFRNTIVQDDDRLVSERPADEFQWFRNSQPVDGATERIFVPGSLGGEYVVATFSEESEGCNNVSEAYLYVVTGLEDLFEDEQQADEVKIYPVPVKEDLNIYWPADSEPIQVQLRDLNGKVIYKTEIIPENNNFAVPMRNLPSGMYWLQIENRRGTFVRKLIK